VSKAAKAAVEFAGERARRVVGAISPEARPATCLQSALRRRRFGCSPLLRSAFVAIYAELRSLLSAASASSSPTTVASTGFAVLRAKPDRLLPGFLINVLRDDRSVDQMIGMAGKGTYPSINQTDVESLQIPLPPLEVQTEIVAEIEGYQKEIERLEAEIANQEENIQRSIARVWGEDSESANGAPPSQPGATPPVSNPKHHEG